MEVVEYYRRIFPHEQLEDEKSQNVAIRIKKAADMFKEDLNEKRLSVYKVLDIGCATGFLSSFLDVDRFHLYGIEINPILAQKARERYHYVWEIDLEESWPVESESFDGVFAGAVLEHVFDYHFVLNEINRVLKFHGMLVVEVPNLGAWKEIYRLIRRRHPHWAQDIQHLHQWTKVKLETVIMQHGFEIKETVCDRLAPPFWKKLRSRWLEKVFASWGRVLICKAYKMRKAVVVDKRLAHLYSKTIPIDSKTVEVL